MIMKKVMLSGWRDAKTQKSRLIYEIKYYNVLNCTRNCELNPGILSILPIETSYQNALSLPALIARVPDITHITIMVIRTGTAYH